MNIVCLVFLLCLPFGLDVRATCPPGDFVGCPLLALGWWSPGTHFMPICTHRHHPPALGELLAHTKAPNGCLLEGRQDFTGVRVFLEELWRVARQVILLSKFRICHKQFTPRAVLQ